jgi:hypothetical protein
LTVANNTAAAKSINATSRQSIDSVSTSEDSVAGAVASESATRTESGDGKRAGDDREATGPKCTGCTDRDTDAAANYSAAGAERGTHDRLAERGSVLDLRYDKHKAPEITVPAWAGPCMQIVC